MAVLQTLFIAVISWLEFTNAIHFDARDSSRLAKVGNCVSLAFVQKTHILTQRILNSAKLAKEQIESCGGYHRVLYYSPDESLKQNEGKESSTAGTGNPDDILKSLRSALGERGVIGIGSADISVAFGLDWDVLVDLANGENVMWHRGDAYEITWYELFSHELPSYITHIWFAEYDVGWTGNLPQLLSSFSPAADFICSTEDKTNGILIEPNWPHFRKRNWMADSDVRQCLVMLVRYSRRMLAAIRADTRMRHFQYSEMTGASICTRHGRWCSVETFNHSHSVIGRDPTSGAALFAWHVSISQELWDHIIYRAKSRKQGHLYHALKW